MRSYTNKDGEKVEVSQEHLDVAVAIKKELQKSSPSMRCNWSTHRKMMEAEGFFDSENSENYRLMIKGYQSSIGELPSATKHAELVADNKLSSIKEAVGELYYAKRESQLENQKLGKIKRELTLYGVIAEQVYDALINELNTEIPKWAYKERILSSKSRMVVYLSDLHVGAVVVNVDGNNYNFSIAQKRLKKYIDRIVELANYYHITDIDVVCLGDITEHVSMRKVNQSFESEFTMSEQLVKAFELIRDFIVNLTDKFNVTYRGISGNHDRMNGSKEDNIDGDSTIFVVNYMIKLFAESAKLERFQYVEPNHINYSAVIDIGDVGIKNVHGDNESGNHKLARHASDDNRTYNILAMGHLHHYHVKEVGQNQFEVYFGSTMGKNNYGKKGKFGSNASQGLIIVHEDGEIDIRRIDLQNY